MEPSANGPGVSCCLASAFGDELGGGQHTGRQHHRELADRRPDVSGLALRTCRVANLGTQACLARGDRRLGWAKFVFW
jgi:hypothetical protein